MLLRRLLSPVYSVNAAFPYPTDIVALDYLTHSHFHLSVRDQSLQFLEIIALALLVVSLRQLAPTPVRKFTTLSILPLVSRTRFLIPNLDHRDPVTAERRREMHQRNSLVVVVWPHPSPAASIPMTLVCHLARGGLKKVSLPVDFIPTLWPR